MIDINKLIAEAMKAKEKERLETLKLIKTELVKAEKNGVIIDDAKEAAILLKMVQQRKDSIEAYLKGNRQDLADAEQKEIDIISEFIPEQPTDEDIEKYTIEVIDAYKASIGDTYAVSMKDMKPILTMVQQKYPTANGKIVSNVLKSKV